MSAPSPLRQMLYLGGLRRAEGEDREWLERLLATESERRLGFLTSVPNAVILAVLGLLLWLTGDSFAPLFLVTAGLMLATGAYVPPMARRRIAYVARKNALPRGG